MRDSENAGILALVTKLYLDLCEALIFANGFFSLNLLFPCREPAQTGGGAGIEFILSEIILHFVMRTVVSLSLLLV